MRFDLLCRRREGKVLLNPASSGFARGCAWRVHTGNGKLVLSGKLLVRRKLLGFALTFFHIARGGARSAFTLVIFRDASACMMFGDHLFGGVRVPKKLRSGAHAVYFAKFALCFAFPLFPYVEILQKFVQKRYIFVRLF